MTDFQPASIWRPVITAKLFPSLYKENRKPNRV